MGSRSQSGSWFDHLSGPLSILEMGAVWVNQARLLTLYDIEGGGGLQGYGT